MSQCLGIGDKLQKLTNFWWCRRHHRCRHSYRRFHRCCYCPSVCLPAGGHGVDGGVSFGLQSLRWCNVATVIVVTRCQLPLEVVMITGGCWWVLSDSSIS